MTPTNQQRADRCEEAVTRLLGRRRTRSEPDRFARRRDALGRRHWQRIFTSLSPRLAATTSTNSMTNNKTKGE